jgi:type II secretory pathway component GspD/PulD (secretin)
MIFDHHRLLAASITALLFCATSCSAPDSGSTGDGATEVGGSGAPGDSAGSAGVSQDPAVQDPAVQDPTIDEQRKTILVEQYLENAQRLRSRGTPAALELARLELLKARSMRPDDERVNRQLEVVAAELELPSGSSESFQDEQERLEKIREERSKATVLALLDSGEQALNAQNYARALEDFRRAQLNIELGRYVSWGDLEARVSEALARAEAARDAAERAEVDQVRKEVLAQRRAADETARARRQAQIDGLLSKGTLAFERRQFKLAQEFAFEAMEVDPANQVARELHNAAVKAGRDSRTDNYYRDMSQRLRQLKLTQEELRVPQNDVLTFDAAVWERASQRAGAGARTRRVSADDEALRARLAELQLQNMSFTDEDDFDEIKRRLQARFDEVPIVITPEARDTIEGEGLTLVMDVTAPIALDDFFDQLVSLSAELAWTVRDGVVQITSKTQAGGANFLDHKDVRDLIFAKTVFLPPTIRDIPSGDDLGDTPRTGGEGEDKTFFVELDTLIANIQNATDPLYWESEGGGSIDQAESGYLLVNANPEMHKRVDRVLEDLRRFSTTVVTIESKFLTVRQNFLQEIGVDFRGLGGSGAKGTVAQLDDITNGLDDNASRGLDNSGTSDPAGNPSSGAFFNDGGDGDVRGRTENFFTNPLGRSLTTSGGATAALVYLDDLELQMILQAVEKKEDVQELNGQNLTVLNNERGHVAIINQTAYVRDFEVEVAQAAFIADPKIDVIQDGIVLDVKPTVSHDRRKITLNMQPTVAELVRPIPTFSTSLAGTTQPVTVQLPQLLVRSFATTVTVPDGGSVLIGGLREVLTKERRAEVPILGQIPLLGFFFKQEGVVDENTSLMVLVRASITDVQDFMAGR